MEVTHGHLLGGRLRYAQPADGYRTGIEPVLLAASVPAEPGQRVFEAGTGAGAGLLCLAARVPDLALIGIELDADMAALARRNLADNGFAAEIVIGDVTGGMRGGFDHAFANPPWHDARSTPSPLPRRRRAKQVAAAALPAWVAALRAAVRPGGTLTLILPASQADAAAEALAGLSRQRRRLLPKFGRPAKLTLLRCRMAEGGQTALPDLVLHEDDGSYTSAAQAVLRGGGALA